MESLLNEVESSAVRLDDEILRLQTHQQARHVQREQAAAQVTKLTEQAATGSLRDPSRLTEALQHHREVSNDDGTANRLQQMMHDRAALDSQVHELRRQAAQNAYSQAVMAYAAACAGLPELADKVRELAPAAGVMMRQCTACSHDGMHRRTMAIGGAVIDVPK